MTISFKNELRNNLQNRSEELVMKFGVRSKKVDLKKRVHLKYFDGPIVYFDGHKNDSIFNILLKLKKFNFEDHNSVIDYLVYHGQTQKPGIYLIDSGGRRAVIQTKNIASSMTKVLGSAFNAKGTDSDLFATRIANSPVVKFEVLSYSQDARKAAFFAGLNDVMNPSVSLESHNNYRIYEDYKDGLLSGGHITSYYLEDLIDQGYIPEFVSKKELANWNKQAVFDKMIQISAADFTLKREEFIISNEHKH